jgi:hypothetical protein
VGTQNDGEQEKKEKKKEVERGGEPVVSGD